MLTAPTDPGTVLNEASDSSEAFCPAAAIPEQAGNLPADVVGKQLSSIRSMRARSTFNFCGWVISAYASGAEMHRQIK